MPEKLLQQEIKFELNGKPYSVVTHPLTRLLDLLREDLGFTGTKEGCGEGECGACTIHFNGRPALACLIPAAQADGAKITTIEGIGDEDELTDVQEAFQRYGGAQCGICTPGMIMSATYYLENPDSAETMQEALAGNQCRCTGYKRIFDAMEKVLKND